MAAERDVEARLRLLAALRAGQSVSRAARAAGLHRSHVYKAVRDDPELAEALAQVQARGGQGRRRRPAEGPPGPAAASQDRREAALACLEAVLKDEKQASRDRVAAARALLAALPPPPPGMAEANKPTTEDTRAGALRVLEGTRGWLAQKAGTS